MTQVSNVVVYQASDLPVMHLSVDGSDNVWLDAGAHGPTLTRIQPGMSATDCSSGCLRLSPQCSFGPASSFYDFAIDEQGSVWYTPDCSSGAAGDVLAVAGGAGVFPTADELSGGTNLAYEFGGAAGGPLAIAAGGVVVLGGGTVQSMYPPGLDTRFELYAVSQAGDVVSWLSGSAMTDGSSTVFSVAVARDGVWAAGGGSAPPFVSDGSACGSTVVWFPSAAGAATGSYSGAGLCGTTLPRSIALDGSGNAFVISQNSSNTAPGNSVVEIAKGSPSDCSSGCTSFAPPWLSEVDAIAVDGANNLWLSGLVIVPSDCPLVQTIGAFGGVMKIEPGAAADCSSGCTLFTTVPSLTRADLGSMGGIAIDSKGNVWVGEGPNETGAAQFPVYEFPGIAAPTTNPIVRQLQ